MIPLTPELLKQIEARGEKIHYVTLEEFQEIISKGKPSKGPTPIYKRTD
jgi:hypothetical protein